MTKRGWVVAGISGVAILGVLALIGWLSFRSDRVPGETLGVLPEGLGLSRLQQMQVTQFGDIQLMATFRTTVPYERAANLFEGADGWKLRIRSPVNACYDRTPTDQVLFVDIMDIRGHADPFRFLTSGRGSTAITLRLDLTHPETLALREKLEEAGVPIRKVTPPGPAP